MTRFMMNDSYMTHKCLKIEDVIRKSSAKELLLIIPNVHRKSPVLESLFLGEEFVFSMSYVTLDTQDEIMVIYELRSNLQEKYSDIKGL